MPNALGGKFFKPKNFIGAYAILAVLALGFGFVAQSIQTISADTNINPKGPCAPLGDVNGDGKVDISDTILLQRATIGLSTLTADQKLRGDVLGLGSSYDMTAAGTEISKYIVGTVSTFAGCSKVVIMKPEGPCPPLGDVNGDGKVDISDTILLQRATIGLSKLTADQKLRGDVLGLGSSYDMAAAGTEISKYIVGTVSTFAGCSKTLPPKPDEPTPTPTPTPIPTATVTATATGLSVTLQPGYNGFVASLADLGAGNEYIIGDQTTPAYTFNRLTDREWETTYSLVSNIGYYILNPTSTAKTIDLKKEAIRDSIWSVDVKRGWNLIANYTASPLGLGSLSVNVIKQGAAQNVCTVKGAACDGGATTLKNLLSGSAQTSRGYYKLYVVSDPTATTAAKAFTVIQVDSSNINTATIPAGKMFWIYLYE